MGVMLFCSYTGCLKTVPLDYMVIPPQVQSSLHWEGSCPRYVPVNKRSKNRNLGQETVINPICLEGDLKTSPALRRPSNVSRRSKIVMKTRSGGLQLSRDVLRAREVMCDLTGRQNSSGYDQSTTPVFSEGTEPHQGQPYPHGVLPRVMWLLWPHPTPSVMQLVPLWNLIFFRQRSYF